MKNRYGNEYEFEQLEDNIYKIVGELSYWRFGGKEGQESIDMNDLGFADPSGGPFIAIGYRVNGRKVVRIGATQDDVILEVEAHG